MARGFHQNHHIWCLPPPNAQPIVLFCLWLPPIPPSHPQLPSNRCVLFVLFVLSVLFRQSAMRNPQSAIAVSCTWFHLIPLNSTSQPANPMREKNAHCVKSTVQTPNHRAASAPVHPAFPRIPPSYPPSPRLLASWHELGWHISRDREVVWNRRAKNAEETSARGQGLGGGDLISVSIEQTALQPGSLSFFVRAGASERGIVLGEKPDSSSPFTLLTSLFFGGHECGRACRVMSFKYGTDRTRGESWPQKTTI